MLAYTLGPMQLKWELLEQTLLYTQELTQLMLELPALTPRYILALIWLTPAQMLLYTPVLRRRMLELPVPMPPYMLVRMRLMPVPKSPVPVHKLVSMRLAT